MPQDKKMVYSDASIAELAQWLQQQLDGREVEYAPLDDEIGILFRVHAADGSHELFVTREALDDYAVADVIFQLEYRRLPDRLRQAPGIRLMFDRFGELREAPLTVHCEGKKYKVHIDRGRILRIVDANGHLLEGLRTQVMPPYKGYLRRRTVGEWCQVIKKFRGPEQ